MSPDLPAELLVRELIDLTKAVLDFSMRSPHLGFIERERIHGKLEKRYLEIAHAMKTGLPHKADG